MSLREHGRLPDPLRVLQLILQLALASVAIAWLLERGRRGLAIAIAVHAGMRLDRLFHHAPSLGRRRAAQVRHGACGKLQADART